MEKLRLVSYAKEIEVNDNGDTILLQVEDQSIPRKLKKLLKTLGDKIKELESIYDEADTDTIEDKADIDTIEDKAYIDTIEDKVYEMSLFAKAAIDDIFGVDTCKKALGDIVPPVEKCIEFINKVVPYFEAYNKERAQRLTKYSPDRIGSSI